MIVRIDRSQQVAQSLDTMVRWCRSGEARNCWPGASEVRYEHENENLYYDVAMRASGLPDVPVRFEEQLGELERSGATCRFESAQLWNWPYGQLGCAFSEYAFTPQRTAHQPSRSARAAIATSSSEMWPSESMKMGSSGVRFDFTLRYMVPAQIGEHVTLDRVRFRQVVERAVDHYLFHLVQSVILFQTAKCSVELPADVEEVVEFCRSQEARQHWPGVRGVHAENGVFTYECALTVAGIPEATLLARELQGPLEGKGRAFHFETDVRWTWPGRELLNVWSTYRVAAASRGSTLLELTLRFVTPQAVAGQSLHRARMDQAIERAAQRYLKGVSHGLESRRHPARAVPLV